MGELVTEADDLGCLIALGEQIAIPPSELAECLTEDRERTLDRRSNQPVDAVVVEADASDGLLDGVPGLDHIFWSNARLGLSGATVPIPLVIADLLASLDSRNIEAAQELRSGWIHGVDT